ncbi:MAG: flagellin [Sulfurimonadaceae bacterium]|nr:flagellin [Sulfurimonadaceae bacterium]
MRITSNMYFNNLYANNSSNLNNALFDVNKQIASGVKIQYAQDDIRIYTDTMRLDNEITTLTQNKNSATSALKFSDQSDVVLNEFNDTFKRMKTLLIKAANGTNSEESIGAIAKELREMEKHLKSLANTSINGQYLFSGSAISTKPIDEHGNYMGNNINMDALIGSQNKLTYNVTGAELFLGEEKTISRELSTNVVNKNTFTGESLTRSSTIRDLMGDNDDDISTTNEHFFYISGTKSDGSSFKEKIKLDDSETVGQLLDNIGSFYGNTLGKNVVDVKLNDFGEIVITDKLRGSSKLDFHIVGATDFTGGSDADVSDLEDLSTNPAATIKEFIKSDNTAMDGYIYDKAEFSVDGAKVSSNVSQILKNGNGFALDSTKLIDVASGATLNGKVFKLEGSDVNGNAVDLSINLNASPAGSTFTMDGGITNYDIFTANSPRSPVDGDGMTYRQLMDVINMVLTDNLPATNTTAGYDNAVKASMEQGAVNLSYNGKLEFLELNKSSTKATMSLYDTASGDFSSTDGSALRFNTNSSLVLKDPKTDFFKTINDVISSVESLSIYPDATNDNPRTLGMENAIGTLDVLSDHVLKVHSTIGAQSNALETAVNRSTLMILSTKSLRSDVLDTDMAEAYLRLAQLEQNFQAMLSTVGKVSKLSLVNYL